MEIPLHFKYSGDLTELSHAVFGRVYPIFAGHEVVVTIEMPDGTKRVSRLPSDSSYQQVKEVLKVMTEEAVPVEEVSAEEAKEAVEESKSEGEEEKAEESAESA